MKKRGRVVATVVVVVVVVVVALLKIHFGSVGVEAKRKEGDVIRKEDEEEEEDYGLARSYRKSHYDRLRE